MGGGVEEPDILQSIGASLIRERPSEKMDNVPFVGATQCLSKSYLFLNSGYLHNHDEKHGLVDAQEL